jgi:RNA recognition motif-containing protein
MTLNNPSKRLFVGSLPYKYTEGELLSLFIPYGKVVAVKIVHNRWGRSRGLGYVEFETIDEAMTAKKQLHQSQINDRTIIVDFAQPDPFATPEGQQRHIEALARRQAKVKKRRVSLENDVFTPKTKSKKNSSPRARQSVYDSRQFGSKVGAKFASRGKRKMK